MVSSNLKNSKQARFVENTLNKTRSKSNLEYLLSQLSDTDSETSEAKFTTTALNSQFIDDVTFHKMSKKSSKSESDLNRFNLYKSSNFEYLLNCLDEPSESMIQNQFFVQIKNIEADKRSIVSKTKTKSTKIDYLKNFKSLKLTDISLLKATVNEIAPVEKEHVLNIGSSAVIIESPLTFKLVKEFEYPLQYIVNYNSTPFIIDKTKTYRKKVINQTKVVSNYTSNILKGKQSDPITADGLVLVKLVKKPNWPNIFGKLTLFNYCLFERKLGFIC